MSRRHQEERQALLHEGSGSTAVNAFVEIVFDNSDNRFSLENSDEVVLRRTVGHKKDEFFLQRKRANKNEIMSLLEGAGFSKSNPYYIVQQGKVNALCTMNDAERLRLFKEVAGTTVYDEKKKESLQKMEENKSSIEKINDILDTIEERLTELRGEKEELTQYQKLDRERRAMEYTLYDKELRKARETLDIIEHERTNETETTSEIHDQARATHDAIRTEEAQRKSKQNALRRYRLNMTGLEADKTAAVTLRTKLQLECKEIEESVKTGEEIQKANEREIQLIDKKIAKAQKDLMEDIGPKYDSAVESLTRLNNENDEAKKKMEGLYAKQGRGRQFSSKKDRDAYLASHIKELQSARSDKEGELNEQRDSLSNLRRSIVEETNEFELQNSNLTKKVETLKALFRAIEEKKRERLELLDSRKEQWRKCDELSEKVKEARENTQRSLADVRKSMPRATSMGLQALSNIVQQERLVIGEQYFGMLIDNMELVDPKFQSAVEVAAQNALFHVIVDTDATAARLMKRLETERLGRVTFLPLNRLRIEHADYPESADVKPLLSQCIKYEANVARAMQHVFGKKLLARNVDAASTWSAKCNMDAITLEGDLCSRKGALTGGYVDQQRSRLRAHLQHKASQRELAKADADHSEVNRKAQSVDQAATNLVADLQRLEAKHGDLNHMLTSIEAETARLRVRTEAKKKNTETIEKTIIPALEHDIASLGSEIERLEAEKETQLASSLSEEERVLLARLKTVQVELAAEIDAQNDFVGKLSVDRQRLDSLLNDNLLKRREELLQEGIDDVTNRRISLVGISSMAMQAQRLEDLELRRRELDDAIRINDEIEARLAELRKTDVALNNEVLQHSNKIEQFKAEDVEITRRLRDAEEKSDRLMNKRTMTVSNRELYMRKIQELGSLPPPAELAKYTSLSLSALMRELEKVNKKLKKYSHVNKKAYDQYVNFNEQREVLLTRKEELDQGAKKVEELIESLDRQKDEAINRTFRGVSSHFQEVFKELCPNGAGELVLRTAMDDSEETDGEVTSSQDSEDSTKVTKQPVDPSNPKVSLYRGVEVKVRFSAIGENYLMSQLSGGQKALVAMALIFSIQRCDPAPFYLFDELDQALDSTYRAAVSALIQKQAHNVDNPTQFIVSTFRPELVSVADRCFGISLQQKHSSLHHLSKKDALHFIANLQSEEEATGDVATNASILSGANRKRKVLAAPLDEESDQSDEGDKSSIQEEHEVLSPA